MNPLTLVSMTTIPLEKCLTFERPLLEFHQTYNVEVRYINYVELDLKYEIIWIRFEFID
jgi:hypothetical protein